MRIRLRELGDEELPAYLDEARRFYAADMVAHGRMSAEHAREKSRRDHASLFPGGKRQAGHHVCAIEVAESGEQVGRMMYALRDRGVLFLYQVELDPDARGQGYGREAMGLLEEEGRRLGATRIELNVFGDNDVARGLYRSLGFAEQAVYMLKEL